MMVIPPHRLFLTSFTGLNIVLRENTESWWAFDTSSVSVSNVQVILVDLIKSLLKSECFFQIMFSPKVNAGEEGVFWMYYSGCSNEPTKTAGEERQLIMRPGLAMSQVNLNLSFVS